MAGDLFSIKLKIIIIKNMPTNSSGDGISSGEGFFFFVKTLEMTAGGRRACNLPSTMEGKSTEVLHVTNVLLANGYPLAINSKVLKKKKPIYISISRIIYCF